MSTPNTTDKERGDITQDELKRILDYNPETGLFRWKERVARRAQVGSVAGGTNCKGYRVIRINRKDYKAHRLAWLYMFGHFPENDTDHINGDKADNRIINLRKATRSENEANKGKPITNTSGYKGVSWHKADKKWMAYIKVNKKQKNLGSFNCPIEAHEVYKTAANQLHKEFANHGAVA